MINYISIWFWHRHTYATWQFFLMKKYLNDIEARYKAIYEAEKLPSAINSLLTVRHDFTAFYVKGFNWQRVAVNPESVTEVKTIV